MKYKYSKIAFPCYMTSLLPFFFLIGYILLADLGKQKQMETLVTCFVVYAFGILRYSGEYSKRYIEILDDGRRFNSFRFRMVMNPISLSVPYADMISIKARKLPLIGLWGIKIGAKNIPPDITLSLGFIKHKQMYKDVCDAVEKHKPDIAIDSYLQQYLEG